MTNEIQLNYYSVIIQCDTELNVAYYLNEPTLEHLPNPLEIGYDSITIPQSWNYFIYERDKVEVEGISTTVRDSVLTIPFEGEQFRIEGPNFGFVEIRLDNEFLATVSLYREAHILMKFIISPSLFFFKNMLYN